MKSWPFKSRLKCRLTDLEGSRIEDPKGVDVGFVAGRANLLFVRKNGRTVCLLRMAPREVLDELFNGMLQRIDRLTADADLTGDDTIRAGEVIPEFSIANRRSGMQSIEPSHGTQSVIWPVWPARLSESGSS